LSVERLARRTSVMIVAAIVMQGQRAWAQGADSAATEGVASSTPLVRPSVARYGAWFAGGWHAPISNYSPLPTDRRVVLVGVSRRFHLASMPWGELLATPSFLPFVYTSGNRRQENVVCRDTFNAKCAVGSSYDAVAVGALPVGLTVQTSLERRFGVSATGDAGGALFSQRVPATRGTRFNFIARFGADVVVRVRSGVWVSAGYRHVHISNGGTGEINPGIDTPVWAFGLNWR
jgi:lipid A 3-O-deacylase PagL